MGLSPRLSMCTTSARSSWDMQHYSALSECITSLIYCHTHTPTYTWHACMYLHTHAHTQTYTHTHTHVIQCHKHTHHTDAYTFTCMHAFKTYANNDVHYRELEMILSMADVAYVQRSQVQSHARLNIIPLTPSLKQVNPALLLILGCSARRRVYESIRC